MMAVIHTNLPKQKQIDQGAKQRLLPWRSERRKGSISHMDRQTDRQTASRKPRCCKLLRTLSTLITGHIRAVHMSVMHSYMCKSIVSHGVLLTIGASVMLAASFVDIYMKMEMEELDHRLGTT
ncbi:hypothetical protein M431DRAFT_280834 [Trichoderma harzianum CBS 226.95]|uniref:Uncharacterized protein n=1 Tax=Trichoderma harzianum CBS 226.95 TaxID=983964 RepID=A0A2T4ANB5_TRIHA|nr:hypothetical protein M431DRAFT_280834 [Trichoderma harzianum CBS 226.95]PTB58565.1 hypothetical protein M431DRAFT_280834 [Trichoderma harzianum CBS 226.95]